MLVGATASQGAELTSGIAAEQLERVFVGAPTQLTLPPGFPTAVAPSLEDRSECEAVGEIAQSGGRDAAGGHDLDGRACPPDASGTDPPPRPSIEGSRRGDIQQAPGTMTSTRGEP